MCGEKRYLVWWWVPSSGSPPRMRGKGIADDEASATVGITPAYAGKSCDVHSNTNSAKDHPRTCGEKGLSTFWSRNHSGSPPHVRGKAVPAHRTIKVRGITPACAGKSLCSCARCPFQRDHPRMCGEKLPLKVCKYKDYGSPPHVRGKVALTGERSLELGITPAYAGKSRHLVHLSFLRA